MNKGHNVNLNLFGFFVFALWCCLFLFGSHSCKKKEEVNKNAYEQEEMQIKQENQKEKLRTEKLKAIRETDKPEALREFLQDHDYEIRAAAAARAGEIGSEDAVNILSQAFEKEARVVGTDISAGIKGEILKAMARTGETKAKQAIFDIVESWLEEGSQDKGDYSHIYDSQYYEVLEVAIESLAAFPDSETKNILNRIVEDSPLFYSLRESAWRELLVIEMREKNIANSTDRAPFLLTHIEPEGVFIEKWWTGNKPGEKTLAASKEAVVEELVTELGWDAVEELKNFTQKVSPDDHTQSIAAARMLSRILVQSHFNESHKVSETEQKEAILVIIDILKKLPDDIISSETAAQIFGHIQISADVLKDQNVWERMKMIDEKICLPGAWKDSAPSEKELGLTLPEGSIFVSSFSKKVKIPQGIIINAYYFSDKPAEEIVTYFEEITGKTARQEIHSLTEERSETRYVIALKPIPQEYADFIEAGITVYESSQGYEEKAFGQIQRTGKSLFRIICLISNELDNADLTL